MKQDHAYDVIIAGAGAAGLTAAAYLSKSGAKVLLCEKNPKTGGLVSSFEHNGFLFDAGIRAFENSGILFPMLKQLGIEMEFVKSPVSVGIGDAIVRLQSQKSLSDYEKMLADCYPDNAGDIAKIMGEIHKVMEYMDVLYGIDNPLFMDIAGDKRYLMKTLLPWLIKYQKNIKKASALSEPVNEYLTKFTSNRSLIDIITQHFFKNTPSFFALSYFGQYLDYSYPVGGTEKLAGRLTEFIKKHGGEIATEMPITTVDQTQNSVITADGSSFFYRKLIWACDAKQLYKSISQDSPTQKEAEQKAMVQSHDGGDSILTVFLGIDLPPDYFKQKGGAHFFFTPSKTGLSSAEAALLASGGDKQELFSLVADYLKLTTFEISCPALRDPALAPQNQTGLIVSTLMDYRTVKRIKEAGWYDEFKQLCIDTVIRILDETVFAGLKSKILFSLCSTPLTLESVTGNAQGAITGWAFDDGKLPAETRLPKIAKSVLTPIPDVYQAGQWSFSPSGLPVCILTGKLAADAVLKKLK